MDQEGLEQYLDTFVNMVCRLMVDWESVWNV